MSSSGSKSSKTNKMPTMEDSSAWVRRVHVAQNERLTPEHRQQILERVERSKKAEKQSRKCKAMKSHAFRSNAVAYEGLQQMARAASAAPGLEACDPYGEVTTRLQNVWGASETRQRRAMEQLDAAEAERGGVVRTSAEAFEDDEEEAMEEAAAMVGSSLPQLMAVQSAVAQAPTASRERGRGSPVDDPLEALLRQLKVEPQEAAECAAKFQLYEGYSQQVEKTRQLLFGFYDDCKSDVPLAVSTDMQRKLRGVDSAEAMGIPDDIRAWIVYHMMKEAEKNNRSMAAILEGFEKTMERLAKNDQTECPVCLEAFTEDGPQAVETLSCCHKICQECWANWKLVTHGHPFCPLCRHEEFLGVVAERAIEAASS